MPHLITDQVNAHLSPGLTIRAGIPHRGGKLAFHAFEKGYPTMVSAQAFWDSSRKQFKLPSATDLHETDFALDSAGFTAMAQFKSKGKQNGIAGVFPWTYSQYLELASELNPSWFSQPDMCCEQEIAGTQDEIDYRVNATATMLEGVLQMTYAWQSEISRSSGSRVAACLQKPPVPVIQGYRVSDYLRSLELMLAVWRRWEPWLAPPRLIGVGSVCRRDLHHPEHGLFAILAALERHVPHGSRLHLFGVKGAAIGRLKMFECISGIDSMAFDLASRINAHKQGVSNTLQYRIGHMTDWMNKAQNRAAPKAGDQFRLNLS
jgi:hypothetical protein